MARAFINVEVDGIQRVRHALEGAKVKSSDFANAWLKVGAKVSFDAKALAPVLTGRLLRSIRASKAKSKATVRAGRANLVYAPIQHYGGYNNIEAKPFLTTALHRNADYARNEVESELSNIINRLGLNDRGRV